MKKSSASGRAHRAIIKPSTAKRRVKRLQRHMKMHGGDGQAINAADRIGSIK